MKQADVVNKLTAPACFVLIIDDTLSHFICLFYHVSDGLYLT